MGGAKVSRWGEIARKAGLHDPHAKLRGVWQTMNRAEKSYLVKAAGLSEGTVLDQVISAGKAEQLKAAIRRASAWAKKLDVGV